MLSRIFLIQYIKGGKKNSESQITDDFGLYQSGRSSRAMKILGKNSVGDVSLNTELLPDHISNSDGILRINLQNLKRICPDMFSFFQCRFELLS